LCARMVRTRVKGNGSKAASSPSTEPNFYDMEPCVAGETPTAADTCVEEEEEDEEEVNIPFIQEFEIEQDLVRAETPEHMIIDYNAPIEEEPATPVSKATSFWDDNDENDLGVIDLKKVASCTEAKFTCLPPVVTPRETTDRRVDFSGTEKCPPMLPLVNSVETIPRYERVDEIHSGDQVFFEGLPFHYLEMKDIEESLIRGVVRAD
jgi:hypothetical protein